MKSHSPTPEKSLEDKIWQLADQNQIKQAVATCQQLNQLYPEYASGWHSTSQLALRLNNPTMALKAINYAVGLQPKHTGWLLQQASCLMRLGRSREARPLVTSLAAGKMASGWQYATLALLLSRLELQKEAAEQYRRAITLEPNRAEHYYNLATVQRFMGDFAASEANLNRAISLNPDEFEAYSLRSQLRKQTPQDNHVAELEALLKKGVSEPRGEVRVLHALAKELEDIGQTQRSFAYLKRGADLRRSLMRYDVANDVQTMEAISQHYGASQFDRDIQGYDNNQAIFILGMPRTGSTLVERIIGSHSDVHAAGELNNFAIELTRLAGKPGLTKEELVQRTTQVDFAALGQNYIESTRPATGLTPHFIDKMPLNFLYAGLIHLALPQARLVHLERHPLDTCYAIYKTLFQDAYPYSYKLEELGHYYVAYYRLMQHWQRVIPGVIHTVRYEQVVQDTDTQSHALLAACGLPWQDQCLRFYDNPQSSTTASASQVRMPVYTSSLNRWRDYPDQLQPLIDILHAAGIPLDD